MILSKSWVGSPQGMANERHPQVKQPAIDQSLTNHSPAMNHHEPAINHQTLTISSPWIDKNSSRSPGSRVRFSRIARQLTRCQKIHPGASETCWKMVIDSPIQPTSYPVGGPSLDLRWLAVNIGLWSSWFSPWLTFRSSGINRAVSPQKLVWLVLFWTSND